MSTHSLNSIKEELIPLIQNHHQQQQAWPQISSLMLLVEAEELWREEEDEEITCFSKWVFSFAEEIGVSQSYLWKVMKAGKVYTNFRERIGGDADIPDMEDIELAADAIVMADRIASGDPAITDQIIEKAMSGEITVTDMKEAWEEVKTKKKEAEEEGYEFEPYMPFEDEFNELKELRSQARKALRSHKWIEQIIESSSVFSRGRVKKPKGRLISNIQIGDKKLPEMYVENFTTEDEKEIKIHLITIGEPAEDITQYADVCWILSRKRVNKPDKWGRLILREDEEGYVIELDEEPTIITNPIWRQKIVHAALLR